MKELNSNRIRLLRMVTCLFFAVGIIMSFKLWTSDRIFPLCPVFDVVPGFGDEFGSVFAVIVVLNLILGIFLRNRWVFITLLALLFVLLVQDQMRWQPWVYMYCFLLISFTFKKGEVQWLPYFQIILIGVYFWAGLHKLNAGFIDITYNKMLSELFGVENQTTMSNLRWTGYLLPIFEMLVAVALIFRKTRFVGVVGAILTHVFILTYLIKTDYNSIVYPWNIAMILFVVILFFRNNDPLKIFERGSIHQILLNAVAILLFLIMPFFSFFNLWDHYLSFKLYSGKTNLFYITIADDQVDKLDRDLHRYFWDVEGLTGGEMINVSKWAMSELNVPFYPETRLFKQVTKSFCGLGIENDKLIAVEFEQSFGSDFKEFKCSDLK